MASFSDPVLEPGVLVRHPIGTDRGLGQVKSVAEGRVTVNFEPAGKRTIDAAVVTLTFVDDEPRESGQRAI